MEKKYVNKYINRLTKNDIKKILKTCNITLIEPFEDVNGKTIRPVEKVRNSDQLIIRCYAPKENEKLMQTMFGAISKSNPELAKTLLKTSVILPYADELQSLKMDLLFIKDFEAFFPMDLFVDENDYKRTFKIQQAYINYCAEKFGQEYIDDYVAYRKQVLENKNEKEM